jgi:exodeoxyribonuclease VII small subunit
MADQPKTFSQKLKRLEAIVAQLEAPDLEIEEGLALLEEGVKLHQQCQQLLTQTQAKISTLLSAESGPSLDQSNNQIETEVTETMAMEGGLFDSPAADQPEESESDDEGLPF